ncbi:MAG: DUF4910 domain-containing protein [Acidobacteria bacterium]|nr:MAG: DUF4910 domain-containing protein [Acidobacteriota bacterium]REJ99495.1 MAG: DUF4910 domain-containing protein [Acidobacteriota bacterium]
MPVPALLERLEALDVDAAGRSALGLVESLYPILRSITGDGVRATLAAVREGLELNGNDAWITHEVPSGDRALDWEVPPEWNVREAWVRGPGGDKVIDLAEHGLHLLSYSEPFRGRVSRQELDEHLHSLPEQPDRIPYRTSYYARRWGFCLTHRQRQALPEGEYEVCIDSTLDEAGSLTYGELFLPGADPREVLLSTHVCHPQLCNDNLSGVAVLAEVAAVLAKLQRAQRRFSYRLLFVPGTIGAICWLARNPDCSGRVAHGLVAANLGDRGGFHYKRSRREAPIDRAVRCAFAALDQPLEIEPFSPFGYDERQYCSPGFDLPVGSLTRTPWGRYPEYHTSGDDLDFVSAASLGRSVQAYLAVLAALEADRSYRNLSPYGEPQLGRRGLYGSLGGASSGREREQALLWMLNQSDGGRSLLDVAERSGIAFTDLAHAAAALEEAQLLRAGDRGPAAGAAGMAPRTHG